MSSVNAIGGSSNAWAAANNQRGQMQARMFAKVDADGSGGVDKAELQTMLAEVDKKMGTSNSTSSADLMTKFDADSDGSLSSDELAKGMKDMLPAPSTMDFAQSRSDVQGGEDPSQALFARLDSNGDGSLDSAEVKVMTDRVQAETGQDSSDAFSRMDGDGDGKVSATEFSAAAPAPGAGAPPPGAAGAEPAAASGGAEAAGGTQGTAGAAGAAGSTSDATTYDALDTNQDGVVSEMERLIGEWSQATTSGKESQSRGTDLARLAQQLYEKVAAGWSNQREGSTLDALA